MPPSCPKTGNKTKSNAGWFFIEKYLNFNHMDIIGKIYSREAAEQKTETFRVQEFLLDASYFDNYNQTNRENFLKMQVKNANIDKLAAIPNGSRVKVFFTIEGRFYDKEDGTKGHAQNLSAFNFEVIKLAENKPATPAAPAPQETDF